MKAPYRIVRVGPVAAVREWPLSPAGTLVFGRSEQGFCPGIDLSPDRRVSRRHAALSWRDGGWWIEDLGSRNGTRLGGRALVASAAVPCPPGVDIELGDSRLTLFPPDWHLVAAEPIVIEIGLAERYSASLAAAGVAPIPRLVIHNTGRVASPPTTLEFRLANLVRSSVPVGRLGPGERLVQAVVPVDTDLAALAARPDSLPVPWEVLRDGRPLDCGVPACAVLGRDVWSHRPEHRPSLAVFVQSGHPLVVDAARRAVAGLPVLDSAAAVAAALFRHFSEDWSIAYRRDRLPTPEDSQRLRGPRDVLWDRSRGVGEATCIDLALLFAGCLEALHQQPLLALVDRGSSWHVLAGVWRRRRRRIDPAPADVAELLDEADWFDPNGCTRDPTQRCGFAEAADRARADLRRSPLLFAVDVAVARSLGMMPLPVPAGRR